MTWHRPWALAAVCVVHGVLLWVVLRGALPAGPAWPTAHPSRVVVMLYPARIQQPVAAAPTVSRMTLPVVQKVDLAPAPAITLVPAQHVADAPALQVVPMTDSGHEPIDAPAQTVAAALPALATPAPALAPVLQPVLQPVLAEEAVSLPRRVAPPATRVARADHLLCPPPSHPAVLRERSIEGAVTLRVKVDSQGRAADVQVLAGSGWRLFDDAALQRVRGCRFLPAMEGGQAVDSWVEFPVRFALTG